MMAQISDAPLHTRFHAGTPGIGIGSDLAKEPALRPVPELSAAHSPHFAAVRSKKPCAFFSSIQLFT